MNLSTIKSPGVYIEELDAFPNSVVQVPTAVPAFIGYTPQAEYEGISYINKAMKISSFEEFKTIYCYEDLSSPANPVKQYNPEYYLVEETSKPEKGDCIKIEGTFYSIAPDSGTIYYMYNSIKLFYDNGGGGAYIVSVGTYGQASKKPMKAGEQILNPNVQLDELKTGLDLLKNEQEPTMYICPEATLLSVENNATLMQEMLLQSTAIQTTISIFDIIGGNTPDPILFTEDIETFRNSTGVNGLSYGVAYYPFIGTTIMQNTDIDYTNVFGGDVKQLGQLLSPVENPNEVVAKILDNIENSPNSATVAQYNSALLNVSGIYRLIINEILSIANILPPSGAMAGVMTVTDNSEGVWKAPANRSIVGAVSLPIQLTNDQQANLNVDAVSGKSINAIRSFTGMGILIWGARTLDGNSLDWKYVSVRRTLIMIEQSCKSAANTYVFEPNTKNTWESVKAMIGSFLTSIWKEGGLAGASASDAFSVECGLGTTMTAEDILKGFMNVTIKIAVVKPAEFIVITLQQQMAKSN